MRKTQLLWNFRFYLLFSLFVNPVFAQDVVPHGNSGDRSPERRSRGFRGEGGHERGEGGGREGWGGGGRSGGRSWDSSGNRGFGGRSGGAESSAHDGGDAGPEASGNADNSVKRPVVSRSQTRITTDLAADYLQLDLDGDGQIAFYEWRQAKRGDLAGFAALDHNGDGFLTPSEIQRGPKVGIANTSGTMLAGSTSGNSTVGGSQTVTAEPVAQTQTVGVTPSARPVSTKSSSSSASGVKATVAERRFNMLDKNKDGSIDSEEWAESKQIRAAFESGSVNLTDPMSKVEFVEHYVKHYPN